MTTYRAPHFDPTVDEIETLKQLEMGEVITLPHALKDHVSGRLLESGFITKGRVASWPSPPVAAS